MARSRNAALIAAAIAAASLLPASHALATSQTWTGSGDGTTWDTSTSNWTPGPTFTNITDSVTFDNTGVANNNISLPTSVTVAALNAVQTTGAVYTINIAAGQSITSAGAVTVGQAAVTATSKIALVGTSGSFTENAGNFTAGGNTSLGTAPIGDFDASGLNSFTYNVPTGDFLIGKGGRTVGKVELPNAGAAPSASITALIIDIGDSVPLSGSTGNNGGLSILTLGSGSNTFNADTILVGGGKASGKITTGTPGGSITITGTAGGSTTANITVGKQSSASGGGGTSSLLLAGDNATVQAGTVLLGDLAGSTSTFATGNATFDTGNFSANSLQIAVDASGANSSGAVGNFTLGTTAASTGTLTVVTTFDLGNATNSSGNVHTTTAAFIINGGTANIQTDINSIDSNANITLNSTLSLLGGTLNMNGHQIGHATGNNKIITHVNMPISGNTATLQALGGTGINDAGLTVNGGGTLILANAGLTLNTYTGNTLVTASSTLLLDGTSNGGGLITVDAGSTLGGNGTTTSQVNAAGDISPGNSIDTLTVGAATITGNLDIQLNDADPNVVDLLKVGGTFDISAATLNLNITGTPSAPAYVFASYGSLGGAQFATVNNLPGGYTIDYNYLSTQQIALVAGGSAPEPASLALLGVGGALLLRKRRK